MGCSCGEARDGDGQVEVDQGLKGVGERSGEDFWKPSSSSKVDTKIIMTIAILHLGMQSKE